MSKKYNVSKKGREGTGVAKTRGGYQKRLERRGVSSAATRMPFFCDEMHRHSTPDGPANCANRRREDRNREKAAR